MESVLSVCESQTEWGCMRQRIPTSERDTYTGRVTVDMTGQFKLFEKSGNPSREIKKGKGNRNREREEEDEGAFFPFLIHQGLKCNVRSPSPSSQSPHKICKWTLQRRAERMKSGRKRERENERKERAAEVEILSEMEIGNKTYVKRESMTGAQSPLSPTSDFHCRPPLHFPRVDLGGRREGRACRLMMENWDSNNVGIPIRFRA